MDLKSEINSKPRAWEKAFTILVLLFSTGAFLNLLGQSGRNVDQAAGMLGMQVAWAVAYAITFVLLMRHCKRFLRMFIREWSLVLLLGLAFLSILWSFSPPVTFRRSAALVGTCMFGLYFAKRYSLKEQLQLLGWMCGIAAVFSLIFGLLGLGTSVDELEGAWIGVYVQRNMLGRVMVLSALVFIFLGRIHRGHRWLAWSGAILSVILILLSASKTALVVFLILLSMFPLYRQLRQNYLRALTVALILMALVTTGLYWIVNHFDLVTQALNRDITMTGRVQLWFLSFVMALHRPWLGYGYSAFWLGLEGPSAHIWRVLNWEAPNAHNGLLDIWLSLGLLGVAIFVVGFTIYAGKALLLFRRTFAPEGIWPLMYLTFLVLINVTESALLSVNGTFWILYIAAALTVSSHRSENALNLPARIAQRPAA